MYAADLASISIDFPLDINSGSPTNNRITAMLNLCKGKHSGICLLVFIVTRETPQEFRFQTSGIPIKLVKFLFEHVNKGKRFVFSNETFLLICVCVESMPGLPRGRREFYH